VLALGAVVAESTARGTLGDRAFAAASVGVVPEYVVQTLRDMETYARAEKATAEQLLKQAQEPLRLPSLDEIAALSLQLDRLNDDPRAGRQQLLRWLKDGKLVVTLGPDGKPYAKGELIPFTILAEAENTKPSSSLEGLVYDVRSGGRI
jgi:hypothetical protein